MGASLLSFVFRLGPWASAKGCSRRNRAGARLIHSFLSDFREAITCVCGNDCPLPVQHDDATLTAT